MIEQATVQRILDTADIVEVVSDFVQLRRRGSNWVGLCPFHNDRTPSFYVSRAKGICKCFSCGKGGSAVNFVMEHEQMSYVEALRYLAAKYHIEIVEREQTDEERQAQSEREAMIMLNEWACRWMEEQLWNTTEGQEIGLAYFRERGFSDATIRKFRLGYSPQARTALYDAATHAGFNRDLLLTLGLCKDDTRGGGFDFYRGRVMFPIFSIGGKVIAFGGRTLRKDDHAKYFNSPESLIYSKSKSTMYGLFQAKHAMARLDKCFIVEGYADVISMHQAGFENVIASSGTALTEGHIHILHRLTQNVTELFDGDEAGIHAALVGIDKLLAEGLNIKVLLLPDGEDPDSYCRSHSTSEVEQYIEQNETDFIRFKSRILLQNAENDPIKRSAALSDIVRSIAVIPSNITRSMYAQDCANTFRVDEQVILREIKRQRLNLREEAYKQRQREQQRQLAREAQAEPHTGVAADTTVDTPAPPPADAGQQPAPIVGEPAAPTYKSERELCRLMVRFGYCYFGEQTVEGDDTPTPISAIEFVRDEMLANRLEFSHPVFAKIFALALEMLPDFYDDLVKKANEIASQNEQLRLSEQQEAEQRVMKSANISLDRLEKEIQQINGKYSLKNFNDVNIYREEYLARILLSHPDEDIRRAATNLATEQHQLSKMYTESGEVQSEAQRINITIPHELKVWRFIILDAQVKQLQEQQKLQPELAEQIMTQLQPLLFERLALSKEVDQVLTSKK